MSLGSKDNGLPVTVGLHWSFKEVEAGYTGAAFSNLRSSVSLWFLMLKRLLTLRKVSILLVNGYALCREYRWGEKKRAERERKRWQWQWQPAALCPTRQRQLWIG